MEKREVIFSAKALSDLETGKRIEGSMILNQVTNQIEFTFWNRTAPKSCRYRIIHHLPNSVMMESIKRVIVRSSVNKTVGRKGIGKAMLAEMKCHAQFLETVKYEMGE
jgi:predicted nucleotide-binding protein